MFVSIKFVGSFSYVFYGFEWLIGFLMLGEELVDAESYLGSLFRVGPVEAMGTGSTVEYFVVELLSFGLESTYHMLYFHYVHVIIASIGMDEQGIL